MVMLIASNAAVPVLCPAHSGLRRPKSWPKVEKDSDMIEILYTKVFGVAEFETEGKSQKFQMVDLKLI